MNIEELELEARTQIEGVARELAELSRRIESNPETAYQELQGVAWVRHSLGRRGLRAHRGIEGVETAFSAACDGPAGGSYHRVVAEYGALPGIPLVEPTVESL